MDQADNEPMVVRVDRTRGFSPDNVKVVSTRAGRLMERYTKQELLDMLAKEAIPDGYSGPEVRRIAEGMVN
jgi:hypothetical protein